MKIFRKTPKKNDKISKNIINIDMVKEKKINMQGLSVLTYNLLFILSKY